MDHQQSKLFKIKKDEVGDFQGLQKNIMNFVANYLDNFQKKKFFYLNKNFYSLMLNCFENVRQTNEKVEECVKREEVEKDKMNREMSFIYKNNLKKLEGCTEKCKSEEDLDCLIPCSEVFKRDYHFEVDKLLNTYYTKTI